jgi:integrase
MPFVTETLKTAASRRSIPLPRFTVDALTTHIEEYDMGPDQALFVNSHGRLWRRGTFNNSVWKPTLLRAGLPTTYGMHALRHTYASTLITAGLHAKVIQTRLGHKSITETMDTYGHLFPHQDHETSNALDRAYGDHPTAAGSEVASTKGEPSPNCASGQQKRVVTTREQIWNLRTADCR